MTAIKDQILSRRQTAEDYLRTKRTYWDKFEQLFHNNLNDLVSLGTKNSIFDPKLSTLVLDRAYRVMAQLPVGKVKPISKNDVGTSKLMNLTLDKYVIPNANAQFDFLTKLRMIDMYSNVYGNFFAMVDWDVKKNGYMGPDMWLLNIRDVFPQVGAVSIEDSDYIIVRTWKPLSYFESVEGQKGYKNIPKILAKLKDNTGSKDSRDQAKQSQRETDQYPTEQAAKKSGYFECLSQFEGDRWVDFCVDADLEFRDGENPHDNGELPIVCKYSIPLLDDYMGMGDFERGASMQMLVNSIWNLYTEAIRISIFPPVLLNKDMIASDSSIQYRAAAKWLVRGNVANAVSPVNLSPQGLQTFSNTYQVANASLLNMFGTSDTSTTANTDPNFGKTPQALQMQAARENARDSADRFYMEQFVKKIMKKMVNLISKRQTSAINIRLFDDDIKELKRTYPEVEEIYNPKTGMVNIPKSKTGSVLYDYELVAGSTYAADEQKQQENLAQLLDLFMKAQTPQGNWIEDRLRMEGYNLNFSQILTRIIAKSGIQDWDKIITEQTEGEKTEEIFNQVNDQFAAQVQQMVGANQVPTQPAPTEPMIGGLNGQGQAGY